MATLEYKAVKYALVAALEHKAIRKLRATHYGACLAIIQAVLKGDIDPFDAKPITLQYYARATPRQWIAIKGSVLEALRLALPDVREVYLRKMEIQKVLHRCGSVNISKYNEKKSLERRKARETHNFVEQSTAPSILQPVKAPRFRNESIDMQQRQEIKKAKPPAGVLHD